MPVYNSQPHYLEEYATTRRNVNPRTSLPDTPIYVHNLTLNKEQMKQGNTSSKNVELRNHQPDSFLASCSVWSGVLARVCINFQASSRATRRSMLHPSLMH